MGAITLIWGEKAEEIRDSFFAALQLAEKYGLQTVLIDGRVEIWDLQQDSRKLVSGNATAFVLPSDLASIHEDLLIALTAGREDVFGTGDQVIHTWGGANGKTF
jgi:hypothetical protein